MLVRCGPRGSNGATDPLYILYTSGTTGRPKGVVRDNGGHAVALKWSMDAVFDVVPGEVFWAASDVGWVVGHSYIVYAPLLHGCTTVMYEGKPVGTPDAGAFWRVIEEHGVATLFTAPTAFQAIKREDPDGALLEGRDLSRLQTETGWPIAANPLGIEQFPVKPGSATKPVPGWDVRVLHDDGSPCAPNEIGQIVVKLPLPPGALPTLWQADDRYKDEYLSHFPGYYVTGDASMLTRTGTCRS